MTAILRSDCREVATPLFDQQRQQDSFLKSIQELIQSFQRGTISLQDCFAEAHAWIPKLNSLSQTDLFQAREGFCLLLQLDDDNLKQAILEEIKPLFHCKWIARHFFDNKSCSTLTALENNLSTVIEAHIRSDRSRKTLVDLLDLYEDVLEHLCLHPFLSESDAHLIANRAKHWMQLTRQECVENPELRKHLTSIDRIRLNLIQSDRMSQVDRMLQAILERSTLQPNGDVPDFLMSSRLGRSQELKENYLRATKHYICALSILESINPKTAFHTRHEAILHYFLGLIYRKLNEYELALKHLQDCLDSEYSKTDLQLINLVLENMGDIYKDLGFAHNSQGNYGEAIKCYRQALKIAQRLKKRAIESEIYGRLGSSYISLGELKEAREHFTQSLNLAISEKNSSLEGEILKEFGSLERDSGNYQQAVAYYNQALGIFRALPLPNNEAYVQLNLGLTYFYIDDYTTAQQYYQNSLQIAHRLKNDNILLESRNGLGIICLKLGDLKRAKIFFKGCVKMAKKLNNARLIRQSLGNLAQVYTKMEKFEKAHICLKELIEKNLASAHDKAIIYNAIGNFLSLQNKHADALKHYSEDLKLSQKLGNRKGQVRAYINRANELAHLKQKKECIQSYEEALKIARQIEDPSSLAAGLYNLGMAYFENEKVMSKQMLMESIQQYASIKKEFEENAEWQITFFEAQSKPYKALELYYLGQENREAALEMSEQRRSQALNMALAKKITLHASPDPVLSIQQIQDLAAQLHTTFVVYSLAPLYRGLKEIFAWVISDTVINFIRLSTDLIQDEIEDLNKTLKEFPFYRSRNDLPSPARVIGIRENAQKDVNLNFVRKELKSNLSRWYDALIAPLEEYLPAEQESLTFALDGFLSQLPFALFFGPDDKYLIEKYPLTTTPSLTTLHLLSKREYSSEKVLVAGNPNTGRPEDDLEFAANEVKKLGELFCLDAECLLTREQVKPQCIKEAMQDARLIFLSCHGLNKKNIIRDPSSINESGLTLDLPSVTANQHSVFEGSLLLAPDAEHPDGYLGSKEISQLNLTHTEFVCLSACFSGTGGLWQEGTIGLVRSFIAAGASTVLAAYWPVYDSQITVDMIEKMAKNLRAPEGSKLTHAKALQKIMIEMIEEHPDNIEEWGVFFLTGI